MCELLAHRNDYQNQVDGKGLKCKIWIPTFLYAADQSLLTVPKAHKVYAKNIDFLTGAKRQLLKLHKAEHATHGQPAMHAEKILSQNSLHNAASLDQIDARYQVHLEQRDVVRNFYNTPTMHSSN